MPLLHRFVGARLGSAVTRLVWAEVVWISEDGLVHHKVAEHPVTACGINMIVHKGELVRNKTLIFTAVSLPQVSCLMCILDAKLPSWA